MEDRRTLLIKFHAVNFGTHKFCQDRLSQHVSLCKPYFTVLQNTKVSQRILSYQLDITSVPVAQGMPHVESRS